MTQAQAATNYDVEVGHFFGLGANCNQATFAGCTGAAESMRIFPSSLKVHKGDTLTFTGGFHTATAIPKNTDAAKWIDDNASGLGEPWSLFAPNGDDPAANPAKLNNAVVFPPQNCGVAAAPCPYDGSGVVNSGAFVFGPGQFVMSVDANAGDYFWVVCLVHPHMRMKVEVVADSAPATNPADANTANAANLAQDMDTAETLNVKLNQPSSHVTSAGKKVWDVYAGYDTHWVTLYGMYPIKTVVKKNETVRYHFDALVYETHTATFPANSAEKAELLNELGTAPSCDPDTDAGPGPNNPPDTPAPPFCNDPSQLEFLVSARAALQQGDGNYTGPGDFENSGVAGVQGGPPARGFAPWDVKFSKVSPKKGFKYLCLIHPEMMGKVVVK
jgi:plastocyanin